jgi:hypothetical protein
MKNLTAFILVNVLFASILVWCFANQTATADTLQSTFLSSLSLPFIGAVIANKPARKP